MATTTTTMTTVWVQLYIGNEASGGAIKIKETLEDVAELKEAVWTKKQRRLEESSDAKDSTELKVYRVGTAVPVSSNTPSLAGNKEVPKNVTYERPLIAVAPPPPVPVQQPDGGLRSCRRQTNTLFPNRFSNLCEYGSYRLEYEETEYS